jgi:hypothetical protein
VDAWAERDAVNDSRRVGRELAYSLNGGAEPRPIPTRMALEPGEFCVGETDVLVLEWLPGTGAYVHKSGFFVGSGWVGLAAGAAFAAFTAAGNSRRRAEAEHDAQYRWRPVDQGRLFLTNYRFCVQGNHWLDVWFPHVRMSECTGLAITLQLAGCPPMALLMPGPDWWYVMFQKLAYNRVVVPPWA